MHFSFYIVLENLVRIVVVIKKEAPITTEPLFYRKCYLLKNNDRTCFYSFAIEVTEFNAVYTFTVIAHIHIHPAVRECDVICS